MPQVKHFRSVLWNLRNIINESVVGSTVLKSELDYSCDACFSMLPSLRKNVSIATTFWSKVQHNGLHLWQQIVAIETILRHLWQFEKHNLQVSPWKNSSAGCSTCMKWVSPGWKIINNLTATTIIYVHCPKLCCPKLVEI